MLSQSIEFHRFGGAAGILAPENKYIRTAGWDSLAREVMPTLDQKTFQRNLNMLRYGLARDKDAARARATLGDEAARFLDSVEFIDGRLLQVDLVTSAAELWALPFEACFAKFAHWLTSSDSGVVITRRIRGGFSDKVTVWPAIPRVLFLHAPAAEDLECTLIDAHRMALTSAIAPWNRGKEVTARELLEVHEVRSLEDVRRFREAFRPTHIHILAHGAQVPKDPFLPEEIAWGLRLGDIGRSGVPPAEIAEVLRPDDSLPVVVTIAACDSGFQANPIFAGRSIAQELHRLGVPIVVASQLPLTKLGSCTFTSNFYRQLLQGADARVALHAARVALRADGEAGHDWLSLVGYVRLPPEGYAAYLDEVGLRIELRLLDAAQARADVLSAETVGSLQEFTEVEQHVRARLESLKFRKLQVADRRDLLNESCGLEASALKRLAELLFVRGLQYPDGREADWAQSTESLKRALNAYRTAYESDLNCHWFGVQQLALEAALMGTVGCPGDYDVIERAAEIAIAAARSGEKGQPSEACWAHGTLTELSLLATAAGRRCDISRAKTEATKLVQAAANAGNTFPVESTRRQINRYIKWWTQEKGYFPVGEDLSHGAREILSILT